MPNVDREMTGGEGGGSSNVDRMTLQNEHDFREAFKTLANKNLT